MVDAHAAHSEEISWLNDNIADLGDRSRRNKIKFRGVPESVSSNQLQQYAQNLFSSLVPSLSGPDLAIDKIHRLLKPSFLPAEVPGDVLLKVHFCQAEKMMSAFRQTNHLLERYSATHLLPDLSHHTLQRCKNLATITKEWRNHKILYKWKYPATLSITYNGVSATVTNLEEGF